MNYGFNPYNQFSPNQFNPNQQQDVGQMNFGVKVLYGVLSGSQSLLHLLGSLVDVAYIFNQLKSILYGIIIGLIKKIIGLIYYILSLKWILDAYKGANLLFIKVVKHKYSNSMLELIKVSSLLCKLY